MFAKFSNFIEYLFKAQRIHPAMEISTRSPLPKVICHPCFLLPNTIILVELRQLDDHEHTKVKQTIPAAPCCLRSAPILPNMLEQYADLLNGCYDKYLS